MYSRIKIKSIYAVHLDQRERGKEPGVPYSICTCRRYHTAPCIHHMRCIPHRNCDVCSARSGMHAQCMRLYAVIVHYIQHSGRRPGKPCSARDSAAALTSFGITTITVMIPKDVLHCNGNTCPLHGPRFSCSAMQCSVVIMTYVLPYKAW